MTELNLDDLADRRTTYDKYRVVHPGNELAWGGATLESVDHPCPSRSERGSPSFTKFKISGIGHTITKKSLSLPTYTPPANEKKKKKIIKQSKDENLGGDPTYTYLCSERLRNLGTLNFLCSSDKSILRCPLIRRQNNSSQQLKWFKTIPFPNRVTLILHDVLDNGVFAEDSEFSLGIDALTGEVALKVLRVRNYNGDGLLRILCCMNTEISNKIAGFVDGFKTFKGDVLNRKVSRSILRAIDSAFTSPDSNLMRFFNLRTNVSTDEYGEKTTSFYRSISDNVPSGFHWPMSPVRSQPSCVKMVSSEFKSGRL